MICFKLSSGGRGIPQIAAPHALWSRSLSVNIFTFPEFRKTWKFVLIEFQTRNIVLLRVPNLRDWKPTPYSWADRILAFADIVDRENVIAGTDCGLGDRVHPQIAWAKLSALRDGAAIASKKLWS